MSAEEAACSYGLNGLDLKIIEKIGSAPGYFIEAGANDGVNQSNTKLLEERYGWTGLLIEPVPEKYAACVRNRPGSAVEWCALVPPALDGQTVRLTYANLMTVTTSAGVSEYLKKRQVELGRRFLTGTDVTFDFHAPAFTLTRLLQRHRAGEIDLLSLDVEGLELDVLSGLDLALFCPRHIVIEARVDLAVQICAYLSGRYGAPDVLTVHPNHYDLLFTRK